LLNVSITNEIIQPMLPHSFIWGHLPIFGKLVASLPPDINHDYVQWAIWSQWKTLFPDRKTCPAVVYVDAWPFTVPMAIVIDPAVSAQFTQDVSAAKISQHRRFFWPLTFNQDVASTGDYGHWRVLRRMFNPAFSSQNITNRVPSILKDVEMFAQVLGAKCGENGSWGPVFELEHATMNLAIDVTTRFLLWVP
jgi:cytochrome P450